MKILIVDDNTDIVEYLTEVATSTTDHEVYGATNASDAMAKVDELGAMDLLISDVVMEPQDGFTLRENLLEKFPNLLTIFISGYDLTAHSDRLQGNKVLQKPILAEDFLTAINAAENNITTLAALRDQTSRVQGEDEITPSLEKNDVTANLTHMMGRQGFTGKLDQFQLVDIIQMCCLSRRSGRLRISKGMDKGVIFLNDGNMIHAICGDAIGDEAIYRIISWDFGEFSLDEGLESPEQTISSGWEHLVMEGVRRRDEAGDGASIGQETEGLTGKMIGDFKVLRKLGEGRWGSVYEAEQTTVQRNVALKVLKQDLHLDTEAVQQFIADASAKANVQHAAIASVFEAGESNGLYFYARELVQGQTLADITATGAPLDNATTLRVIRVVSEALSYLNHFKIPHSDLEPGSIFLDDESNPRLANLATVLGEQTVAVQTEIGKLATIVSAATQEGAAVSPQIRGILSKMMMQGQGGFLSWGALIQSVRSLEPKVVPQDAYKLNAQDEAAIHAVEAEKKRQRLSTIISTSGVSILVAVVLGLVVWKLFFSNRAKNFNDVVKVPAGEFIYQKDDKVKADDFWIDKYEVSIGMYSKFVRFLENNPTKEFDHPNQPKTKKNHKPYKWDGMYRAARKGRITFNGVKINLNYPVMNIDWWDAYAYAAWRGGRLPTEQEWEKAARGTEGFIYPWGNEFIGENANTILDLDQKSDIGKIDGYSFWGPVDGVMKDKSPFGAIGMAGNVMEWTGSWAENPRSKAKILPVIRGGSYESIDREGNPNVKTTQRTIRLLPDDRDTLLGFRVVYLTPPGK